jgi:tetratricopeptide (TPR) repeat protein
MAKVWNEEDNVYLRENFMKLTNQELAEKFNVSKKSIQGKLRRLGLHRTSTEPETVEIPLETTEPVEEKDDVSRFRPKRLTIDIRPSSEEQPKQSPYVAREQTERRKRAVREFDNAVTLLHSGKKEKGIEELHFVIKTFTSETDLVDRARLYLKKMESKPDKQPPEATNAEEYYHLGIWMMNNHQFQDCEAVFRKALELDPEYTDALYNLACIASINEDYPESIRLIREVLALEEHYIDSVVSDSDFEPLWTNEDFVELIQSYFQE